MAKFNLYKDGEFVNSIEADLSFTEVYCHSNGYTYEEVDMPEPEPVPVEPEPTVWDELDAAYQEGVDSV